MSSKSTRLPRTPRQLLARHFVARIEQLEVGAQGKVRTGLPRVVERIDRLSSDPDFAWRWFACILLAEELEDD